MTKNIMIVGVGGQGTLLTSRIIGKTALTHSFVYLYRTVCLLGYCGTADL